MCHCMNATIDVKMKLELGMVPGGLVLVFIGKY